mmetsp:Transcript_14953/g.33031  ORF Transcript_14953/g.33031 Transcript_14953/m.33031 type:complete len:240 (-) Transcript_14953:338-1057(-)
MVAPLGSCSASGSITKGEPPICTAGADRAEGVGNTRQRKRDMDWTVETTKAPSPSQLSVPIQAGLLEECAESEGESGESWGAGAAGGAGGAVEILVQLKVSTTTTAVPALSTDSKCRPEGLQRSSPAPTTTLSVLNTLWRRVSTPHTPLGSASGWQWPSNTSHTSRPCPERAANTRPCGEGHTDRTSELSVMGSDTDVWAVETYTVPAAVHTSRLFLSKHQQSDLIPDLNCSLFMGSRY